MGAPSQSEHAVDPVRNGKMYGWQRINKLPHSVRFALPLIFLVAVGGLVFLLRTPYLAWRCWRQAEQKIEEHEWDAAREHLRDYLQIYPSSIMGYFELARVCRRGGDLVKAQEHIQKARRLGLDLELVSLENRLIQVQSGILNPHASALKEYVKTNTTHDKYIFEAVIVGGLQSNAPGIVFDCCECWEKRYPYDWQPPYWRGRLLEHSLLHSKAVEQYQAALKKAPEFAPAHLRIANVLLFLGRFPEAITHCRYYLKRYPEHPWALLQLARCEHGMGQNNKARTTLAKLLARNPKSGEGLLLLGRLELESSNPKVAVETLQKAESLLPADTEMCQLIASALRQLERHGEAQLYVAKRKVIEKDMRHVAELTKEITYKSPKDADLRCELGKTYIRLRNYEEGIRWLISGLMTDANHEASKAALRENLPRLGDPRVSAAYQRYLSRK